MGGRLERMQLLFQERGIGARRAEFLARDDAFDDLADLFVNERLAARNGDHRRAALVDRVETLLHREALVEDRVRIVDLAAAEAGEVAAEQWLEHQHERIALTPSQTLTQHIGTDDGLLSQRYTQNFPLSNAFPLSPQRARVL